MAPDPLAPLKFGIRIGVGVLRFELRVLEQLLGLGGEVEAPVAPAEPFGGEPPRPEPVAEAPPVAEQPPVPPPVFLAPDLEPEAPAHIDTEPELVGEFAEAGAEEGVGAAIRVDEPWEGYRKTPVAGIRDRIVVAQAEELAVIQLYEMTHRRRRTVLDAVERRTKQLANAPARS